MAIGLRFSVFSETEFCNNLSCFGGLQDMVNVLPGNLLTDDQKLTTDNY